MNKFNLMASGTLKQKRYAGIGSRETPDDILLYMRGIASKLYDLGYELRSGGAIGADSAFESGAHPDKCEIFRASDATEAGKVLAAKFHPAWDRCNDYARCLHGRNSMIILGQNLDTPVDFVICWTSNGKAKGGTGLGIRIAEAYNIPVFNLKDTNNLYRIITNLKVV